MAFYHRGKIMTFRWKGINSKHLQKTGELEAHSTAEVRALLRSQQITPTKIEKIRPSIYFKKKSIATKDITQFTRQMATLAASGIPWVQALEIIAKSYQYHRLAELIKEIKSDVAQGYTLKDAFKKHPKYFNTLYINLIHAGEQSGSLAILFNRLAIYREKTAVITGKIRQALFYPTIVIVLALIIMIIILLFVIPQFQELFKNFGAELPFFTTMVIKLAQCIRSYGWLMFTFILGLGGSLFYVFKYYLPLIHLIDKISLRIPIIGSLLRKSALARFCRTLATLLAAGIPLAEGLKLVANATGNIIYTCASIKMSQDISAGETFQQALHSTQVFPAMLLQMLAIGEESGQLENMLNKVADFYEEEVDNAVKSLASLIEPFIMVLLGIIIGGLIIAMYLPIFKLGTII